MTDIVMPRLSDSMTEGTVVRWLKGPGDAIRRGEPLAEIETDKATITYESDLDGVITQLVVAVGQTVPVGTPIALVESAAAQQQPETGHPAPLPLETQATPLPLEMEPAPLPVEPAAPLPVDIDEDFERETDEFAAVDEPPARVKASPIARRLAKKLGVDVSAIAGSGPGGRVVKEDVEAAADAAMQASVAHQAPTQAPAPPENVFETDEFERDEDPGFPEPLPATPEPPAPVPAANLMPPPQAPAPIPPTPAPQPPLPQPPSPQPPMPQMPPPMPQPYPPQPYPPQPAWPVQQPVPAPQPFPSPPPFVQGMTGSFPAIGAQQPPPQQAPPQPPPQQPPPQQPPPQAQTATRGMSTPIEPTSAQQTVARRMAESKATAPEFFVETEVDMTTCVAYREQLRSMVSPLPSFNDFVIKAAAQALRQYPKVNAAYKDGHFEQYSDVNIGVVVSASELLAVPTLFNVDRKGLAQIAGESQQLAESVRTRTIQPSQMSGGTFSISNLGMYGVDRFTAILNPPQAAILAVGAINRRAVIAEDGMSLVIRQIMNMTLTCDHRILYGAEAAEFLGAIKAWLESPQLLQV